MSEDEGGDKVQGAAEPEPLHPRAARLKLAHAQDYLGYLEFARRARLRFHEDTGVLDREIETARNMVANLAQKADARIDPRKKLPRPVRLDHLGPRPEYILFLDESGAHALKPKDDRFPVFCLCGVIVEAKRYAAFDRGWKDWKARWLGSRSARIHEPIVRKRAGWFYDADPAKTEARITALNARLRSLPFSCIAATIDKIRFIEMYPEGKVDDFLPTSAYLMCVDFIMERFTHFLCHVGNGAQGTVRAESRGLKEDAEVHHEYIRLHLEGTQFCSESQFRGYLRPSIQFERKDGNSSGLQVADLMARPIADKVLNPNASPERWDIVASKLYDGTQGRRSSYGLKIFPASEADLFGEYLE
ncbi:MAG: DUF3800 domain-containing protein [Candidatus Binatia bacterium]